MFEEIIDQRYDNDGDVVIWHLLGVMVGACMYVSLEFSICSGELFYSPLCRDSNTAQPNQLAFWCKRGKNQRLCG